MLHHHSMPGSVEQRPELHVDLAVGGNRVRAVRNAVDIDRDVAHVGQFRKSVYPERHPTAVGPVHFAGCQADAIEHRANCQHTR